MQRTSPAVNLALFLLTVLSTLLAGVSAPEVKTAWDLLRPEVLWTGAPYSFSVMAILLCHEFGHYFAARLHKVDTSLPFFLPLPLPPYGTLGAVIRIRSKLPSFRAVLDIGASGPIAGFLVALPLLAWGLAHSTLMHGVPASGANPWAQSPFAYLTAVVHHSKGPMVEGPQIFGDSLLTWALTRLIHGKLPPGSDLLFHPVAFAGWVGMFITTLNMIPVGQLDGGHVVYALFGRWGPLVSRLFSHALLGLGLFASWNWLLWWALTRMFVGVDHPMPADLAPIDGRRKAVAVFSLVILVLTFVPVPVSV